MSKRDNKGRFKAGASGNPGGRPKGSSNKTAAELRELYAEVSFEALQELLRRIPRLSDALLVKLAQSTGEYTTPKMRQTQQQIDFSNMPPHEAARVVLEAANIIENEQE